jgi:hypothetical protein
MDDRADRINAALARITDKLTERDALKGQLDKLQKRIDNVGGIEIAVAAAAWKSDALAKIDTLPSITRSTVKKLLELE